jgi:hypothetical protein
MFKAVGFAVLFSMGCRLIRLPKDRLHLPWSLTSINGSTPGRMIDNLLPIPDAEYPAFYPIGIKASCVCIVCGGVFVWKGYLSHWFKRVCLQDRRPVATSRRRMGLDFVMCDGMPHAQCRPCSSPLPCVNEL